MALALAANELLAVELSNVGSREISSQLQLELVGSDQKPKISVGRYPLLQLISGNFSHVTVTVDGICTPGPRLSSVDTTFDNVDFSLAKAIQGKMPLGTIGNVNGSVTVNYADINAYLNQFSGTPAISADGKALKLGIDVQRKNQPPARVFLSADVTSQGRGFQITPTTLAINGYGTLDLDPKAFTFPIELDSTLPKNVDVNAVRVKQDGVEIDFSGSDIDLTSIAAASSNETRSPTTTPTTAPANTTTTGKSLLSTTTKCLPPLNTPTSSAQPVTQT